MSYVTGECIDDGNMSMQIGCDSNGYVAVAMYVDVDDCSGSYANLTMLGMDDTESCLTTDSDDCDIEDDGALEMTVQMVVAVVMSSWLAMV